MCTREQEQEKEIIPPVQYVSAAIISLFAVLSFTEMVGGSVVFFEI